MRHEGNNENYAKLTVVRVYHRDQNKYWDRVKLNLPKYFSEKNLYNINNEMKRLTFLRKLKNLDHRLTQNEVPNNLVIDH